MEIHYFICFNFLILSMICTVRIKALHQKQRFIRIPRRIWQQAVNRHQQQIHELLEPGLLAWDHPLNSGMLRQQATTVVPPVPSNQWVRALDPKHPIYNFLIEYYGLKGVKGTRRLARWFPSPSLLMHGDCFEIGCLDQLDQPSSQRNDKEKRTNHQNAILLEDVTDDDFANNLHLRGASITASGDVIYSPMHYFHKGDDLKRDDNARSAASFLWYRSIIQQTLASEPILHCYGLHEWAMQYQPENAPPPPSAKYQDHLPLRVSRQIINETVERKGVSCTHVDALRFFATDALPLNKYGGPLERSHQVKLEQKGCVHAHMDLLKMALKLQPFCDPMLLSRVLEVALEARKLDVAASPYDATAYDGVGVVPIETPEGRAEYRTKQKALMRKVEPVRRDLLSAYDMFLTLAFDEATLEQGLQRLSQENLVLA